MKNLYDGEWYEDYLGIFYVESQFESPYKHITYYIKQFINGNLEKKAQAVIDYDLYNPTHLPNFERELEIKKQVTDLLK